MPSYLHFTSMTLGDKSARSLSRIGIMGGTFDPIHFGHLRMAQELATVLDLAEVRFIPSATPPHRDQPITSARQRAEMVTLAIADNPVFKLDTRELEREGYSYTIDTLQSLHEELQGQARLYLLMGLDAFVGIASWHRWQELLQLTHIVVATRPGATLPAGNPILDEFLQTHQVSSLQQLHAQAQNGIYMHGITALDISATHIRHQLHTGQSPRYQLPQCVLAYIEQYSLYR
ncbi:nicotinate-nucleotide adenylyltransferase [Methylobacillus rhizosphaerae]|uniref:Probable nicotinate-nucleotide adenylyltransferase n=1 Tax=Methylobacillus rhizosphaerae TaxID=551994 RepID=A0A238Y2T0_9PROT|nr:nicotinate-nucleotide adenylyltransferase [Methylobacillus rhizosphaerae]SNR65320.1 nicotinate-nucleotide adenylyltransferase [Methylobacillus rhizosphaerae]